MTSRLVERIGKLWTSISFRLTLNYGLLATLTTLALIAFIYLRFMDALYTQQYRQIEQSSQRLVIAFEEGGRSALTRAIELTLSDRIDSEREFYLLLDEHGTRLAGNLDALPDLPASPTGVAEARIIQDGKEALGHLKIISLPDGSTLVAGHDTNEIDDITSLIARSVLVALFLALIFIVVGAYIFRRELDYRVSNIRRTAAKIGPGDLSQRIPLSSIEDEFTHLHRDINAMLDRIEVLMKGVRYVSDTIAHNLRTPLMRVIGRLRLAQRPGLSRDEILEATRDAVDEIENLNVLFGKLLQIAEMEAGVRRQPFRPCRLDTIARDVVDMYDAYAEEKGLRLTLSIPARVSVYADSDLIASALANLIDNALKYATQEVHVSVSAGKSNTASITIRDDGPGVPSHALPRLGTHFFRLNSSPQGHGLGLTSVSAIVNLHDGNLSFVDAQPGLQVTISLPIAK